MQLSPGLRVEPLQCREAQAEDACVEKDPSLVVLGHAAAVRTVTHASTVPCCGQPRLVARALTLGAVPAVVVASPHTVYTSHAAAAEDGSGRCRREKAEGFCAVPGDLAAPRTAGAKRPALLGPCASKGTIRRGGAAVVAVAIRRWERHVPSATRPSLGGVEGWEGGKSPKLARRRAGGEARRAPTAPLWPCRGCTTATAELRLGPARPPGGGGVARQVGLVGAGVPDATARAGQLWSPGRMAAAPPDRRASRPPPCRHRPPAVAHAH